METDTVEHFWIEYSDYLKQNGLPKPVNYEAWHFCNDENSARHLAGLAYSGQKTATASSLWSYQAEGSPIPKTGDISVITFWDKTPVCVIETTQVEVIPFNEVSPSFAYDEGEGDRSLDYWRQVHLEYFTQECAAISRIFEPIMPVVCEHFRVVYRKKGLFIG